MANIKHAYSCMLTLSMDIVGGKWKLVILWHLRKGALRFNELKRLLEGITQKILTQQLRELEETGLLTRTVHAASPPKVEYALAAEGEGLIPLLEDLCQWGTRYAQSHGIEERASCAAPPTCHKASADQDSASHPRAADQLSPSSA